jgi:non-ribosomal peptide synthetase component E (peptide arylation enzyme)
MQIEELLENSAERSPDTIALVRGKKRLSYVEIEARCNNLAQALIEIGVEP